MTPLVFLTDLSLSDRTFVGKLEGENPSGSIKDRMVGVTLDVLEREGAISAGTALVSASSGNTGIALAAEGKTRGYSVTVCVPSSISEKKKERIQALGAELIECDVSENPDEPIARAAKLGNTSGYHYFNQFENPHHVHAYRSTLGDELLKQLESLGERIDALVCGVGSGGCLLGVGGVLRERHNRNLKIVSVRPDRYPTRLEGIHPGQLRGEFPIWANRPKGFEDEEVIVADENGLAAWQDLRQICKLPVGRCSGAVLYAARTSTVAQGRVLLVFSDNIDRYEEI